MTYLKIKNRAVSTLASDVTDVATSWTLATGEGAKFPTTGDFHVTCEDEIVKCTSRSSDVLTVVREQEGTTGAAHVAGKSVELRITAGVVESRTTWTLNKLLKGAGAGVAPTEIDVPSARTVATGSYTGDGTDNRQITTGFKCSFIVLSSSISARRWTVIPNISIYDLVGAGGNVVTTDCLIHATDGFEVDNLYANANTQVYRYWAISE